MKRQIRCGVFESNSSSMHAICISKKKPDMDELPSCISFTHGEFGWEYDIHDGLWSRASYLYQAICDLHYGDEKGLSECINQISDTLGKYGIVCDFEPIKRDEYGFTEGYIDHAEGTSKFVESVLHSENRLLRYLCGDSFIVTGNDNSDAFFDWEDNNIKKVFEDHEVYKKGN